MLAERAWNAVKKEMDLQFREKDLSQSHQPSVGKHRRCWVLSLDRDLLSHTLKLPFIRDPHKTQVVAQSLGTSVGSRTGWVVKSIVE